MTTFNNLIDDALTMLHGYVRNQEQTTWLTAALDSSAITLSVNNGARIGMGRVEVDDELMFVDSITGSTVALAPWGRALDGTTAASHVINSKVTFTPLFPRSQVKVQLNNTINAIGTQIQVPSYTTFSFVAPRTTYALPADVDAVSEVSWQVVGPSRLWQKVKRWTYNQVANTTEWPTGKTIDIFDSITPGRTVQINYFKDPSELSAGSDTLETTAGLPASCRDVVVLGAVAKLLSAVDASLLDQNSVAAGFFDEKRQPGSASTVARTIYALYQQRLSEETDRFRSQYPTPVHYRR